MIEKYIIEEREELQEREQEKLTGKTFYRIWTWINLETIGWTKCEEPKYGVPKYDEPKYEELKYVEPKYEKT